MTESLNVEVNGKWYRVDVEDLYTDPVLAIIDDETYEVTLSNQTSEMLAGHVVTRTSVQKISEEAETPSEFSHRQRLKTPPNSTSQSESHVLTSPPSAVKTFTAPMPGTILSILVDVGEQIVTGDTVCVLEAMKMQQSLRADWSGIVKAILVDTGQQVMDGTPILELE